MISAILAMNQLGVLSATLGATDEAESSFRTCLVALSNGSIPHVEARQVAPCCKPYFIAAPQTKAPRRNSRVLLPVLFDGWAVLRAFRPRRKQHLVSVATAIVMYNLAIVRLLRLQAIDRDVHGARKGAEMLQRAGRLLARVVAETRREDPLLALLHICLVCNLAALGRPSPTLIRHSLICLARYSVHVPEDLNEHVQRAFQCFAPSVLPGTSFSVPAAGAA